MSVNLVNGDTLNSDFTAICNKIREKTGGSSPISYTVGNPSNIVSAIDSISGGGGSSNLAPDIVWTAGAQLDSSGNVENVNYARVSDFIDVETGFCVVAYKGITQTSRNVNLRVCGYDANGVFVKNLNNQTWSQYWTSTTMLAYMFEIPSTVSKMRMSNPLIENVNVELVTQDVGNY